jgi:hypothetical protein
LIHQWLAALGNQPVHIRLDIRAHIRVRVLIDTDGGGGMGDIHDAKPAFHPAPDDRIRDFARYLDQLTAARGPQGQFLYRGLHNHSNYALLRRQLPSPYRERTVRY